MIANILQKIGIDQKVGTGLFIKMISMLAGPIGSLLIVYTMTAEKQGLYYLFNSMLALRMLFELGVGTSVIQLSSYARTKNSSSEECLSSSFVTIVNKWLYKAAILYSLIAGIGGYFFISSKIESQHNVISAWTLFIVISALQFASEGKWAMLEGLDKVYEVNKLRIRNNLIQYFTQWILLLAGADLYSFCIASLASYLSQEWYFFNKHRWLYQIKNNENTAEKERFSKELLGLVKRAGQTYLAGYFVFQIQQPICFHFLGATPVAQIGFTCTVANALMGLPVVWLSMNFPKLSHLIANSQVNEARKLFIEKFKQSLVMTVLAYAGAISAIFILRRIPKFSDRLLDTGDAIILLSAFVLQSLSMSLIYWPRSFKVEPFTNVAYTQMMATPVLFYICVKNYGITGASLANLITWIIGFAGISLISKNYWVKSRSLAYNAL